MQPSLPNPIKFNEAEYKTFDNSAKIAAKKIFQRTDCMLVDNPDIFGVDFLVMKESLQKFTLEVEVKRSFKTFDSLPKFVHIPERKRKFFIVRNSLFLLFNIDCTLALFIDGATILKCEVIEKKTNRDYSISDKFFSVGLERFSKIYV